MAERERAPKRCVDCGEAIFVTLGAKKYCASCSDARVTARKADGNAERLRRRRERLKQANAEAKPLSPQAPSEVKDA